MANVNGWYIGQLVLRPFFYKKVVIIVESQTVLEIKIKIITFFDKTN